MSDELWDILDKVGVITGIIAFFIPIIGWVFKQITNKGPKEKDIIDPPVGKPQTPGGIIKGAFGGIARGGMYGAILGFIGFAVAGAILGIILAIKEGQADAVGLVVSIVIGGFWGGILGAVGLAFVGALMGIIVALTGEVHILVSVLMGIAFSLIIDVTGNVPWNGIAGVITGALLGAMLNNAYGAKK
ncbi:MAG: hypothetical protein H6662_15505 [Ardenticatenaceae bacterium]|nr:hypothetical protein [Ardenticatenaceae bacterium]MCB8990274.1 hypothetical protein [Ardenticatenaceae bacterium]